jgi:hypothetical protein
VTPEEAIKDPFVLEFPASFRLPVIHLDLQSFTEIVASQNPLLSPK